MIPPQFPQPGLLPSPQSRIRASEKVVVVLAAPLGGHLVSKGQAKRGRLKKSEHLLPCKLTWKPKRGANWNQRCAASVSTLVSFRCPFKKEEEKKTRDKGATRIANRRNDPLRKHYVLLGFHENLQAVNMKSKMTSLDLLDFEYANTPF